MNLKNIRINFRVKTLLNEIMKKIQDLKTEFTKVIEILKKT